MLYIRHSKIREIRRALAVSIYPVSSGIFYDDISSLQDGVRSAYLYAVFFDSRYRNIIQRHVSTRIRHYPGIKASLYIDIGNVRGRVILNIDFILFFLPGVLYRHVTHVKHRVFTHIGKRV